MRHRIIGFVKAVAAGMVRRGSITLYYEDRRAVHELGCWRTPSGGCATDPNSVCRLAADCLLAFAFLSGHLVLTYVDETGLRARYESLAPELNERARRIWAATEAREIARGGIALVSRATKISHFTIVRSLHELKAGESAGVAACAVLAGDARVSW